MHAAIVRIVVDEDIAFMHIVAEMRQHRLQGNRDRAQMAGQRQTLCDEPPVGVADRRAVIHDVLEDAGIGCTVDRQYHLVADGGDRIAEQFLGDWIGHRAFIP